MSTPFFAIIFNFSSTFYFILDNYFYFCGMKCFI